jgi:hydrogenase maturation protein HypF
MRPVVNLLSDGAIARDGPRADSSHAAVRVLARGHVQGVGFRPYVLRLARRFRLGGRVYNTVAGVVIELEGSPEDLTGFQECLLPRPQRPQSSTASATKQRSQPAEPLSVLTPAILGPTASARAS